MNTIFSEETKSSKKESEPVPETDAATRSFNVFRVDQIAPEKNWGNSRV